MMGKTHLIVSSGVTLSILGIMGQEITLPVIAITAVSALLPDIDEPNSLIVSRTLPVPLVRTFKFFLFILSVVIYFAGAAYSPWNMALAFLIAVTAVMPGRSIRKLILLLLGAACFFLSPVFSPWQYIAGSILIICALVPHRGLTHTLYAPIGWAALLYWTTYHVDPAIWLAGGLSYLIHLFPCDAITARGITPLPPLKWKWRLKWMSTGSRSGSIVESASILLTIILIWYVFFRNDPSVVMPVG